MFEIEIFYKTELARRVLAERAPGLPQRLRAALILIDGKTRWSKLREMLCVLGDPADIVQQLMARGLLESDHSLPPLPLFQAARPQPAQV
ncbi:hypothetical protein [Uliginosibacterium sediminicola]|uniref:Uncharacterized protein n=1 Tax=Uliginosibacterium sediminicola TaxID=2024550 RepID=A0ABU9YTC8_9RHOO